MAHDPTLVRHLDAVVSELESAVRRGSRGSESAFLTAAVHLRTLIGKGNGNDLLDRSLPSPTLHPLKPIAPNVLQDAQSNPGLTFFPGAIKLGVVTGYEPDWALDEDPISVAAWRRESLMIATNVISLGEFVQKMGNQRGAHIDAVLGEPLASVRASGKAIVVGGQAIKPERMLTLALAAYVAKRTRSLMRAD